MWRTVIILGCAIGAVLTTPIGLKNMQIMDEELPNEKTEAAMSTLNLPSNATSIRSDIVDSFSCVNKTYGYYADVENECQIFHVCLPVTYPDGKENMFRWSFICPEETLFSQESFTCVRDEDMNFDCDESERFYELNRNFGMSSDASLEMSSLESDMDELFLKNERGSQMQSAPSEILEEEIRLEEELSAMKKADTKEKPQALYDNKRKVQSQKPPIFKQKSQPPTKKPTTAAPTTKRPINKNVYKHQRRPVPQQNVGLKTEPVIKEEEKMTPKPIVHRTTVKYERPTTTFRPEFEEKKEEVLLEAVKKPEVAESKKQSPPPKEVNENKQEAAVAPIEEPKPMTDKFKEENLVIDKNLVADKKPEEDTKPTQESDPQKPPTAESEIEAAIGNMQQMSEDQQEVIIKTIADLINAASMNVASGNLAEKDMPKDSLELGSEKFEEFKKNQQRLPENAVENEMMHEDLKDKDESDMLVEDSMKQEDKLQTLSSDLQAQESSLKEELKPEEPKLQETTVLEEPKPEELKNEEPIPEIPVEQLEDTKHTEMHFLGDVALPMPSGVIPVQVITDTEIPNDLVNFEKEDQAPLKEETMENVPSNNINKESDASVNQKEDLKVKDDTIKEEEELPEKSEEPQKLEEPQPAAEQPALNEEVLSDSLPEASNDMLKTETQLVNDDDVKEASQTTLESDPIMVFPDNEKSTQTEPQEESSPVQEQNMGPSEMILESQNEENLEQASSKLENLQQQNEEEPKDKIDEEPEKVPEIADEPMKVSLNEAEAEKEVKPIYQRMRQPIVNLLKTEVLTVDDDDEPVVHIINSDLSPEKTEEKLVEEKIEESKPELNQLVEDAIKQELLNIFEKAQPQPEEKPALEEKLDENVEPEKEKLDEAMNGENILPIENNKDSNLKSTEDDKKPEEETPLLLEANNENLSQAPAEELNVDVNSSNDNEPKQHEAENEISPIPLRNIPVETEELVQMEELPETIASQPQEETPSLESLSLKEESSLDNLPVKEESSPEKLPLKEESSSENLPVKEESLPEMPQAELSELSKRFRRRMDPRKRHFLFKSDLS